MAMPDDEQAQWRAGPARYPFFGEPPTRAPRPASQEPALKGKRIILSSPEGFIYDMRAASEIYTDGQGNVLVDILTERNYYTGHHENPSPWPAYLVWVDT
jgi:hypothetical protein